LVEWRKDGAGHHHYCWSQFLAGYIHPVWWHPPDDGRQPGGGRGAGGSNNIKQTAWWSAPSSSTLTPGGSNNIKQTACGRRSTTGRRCPFSFALRSGRSLKLGKEEPKDEGGEGVVKVKVYLIVNFCSFLLL